MLNKKRIIAVIPARGGSKSIPRKNITPLAGKPLLLWTIEVAKQVQEIDRVIVSTDDEEISEVAATGGAEIYRRPADLATDEALVIDALRDLVAKFRGEGERADILVLLEPTCPLRSAEDIRKCIELLVKTDNDSVATFKEAELNPIRAWKVENDTPGVFIPGVNPWMPRQKLPKAYQLNGAVYAFKSEGLSKSVPCVLFGKTAAVIMPWERSVDIDSWHDIYLAESIVAKGGYQ